MVLEHKTTLSGTPAVIAGALSEIKEALRELRHSMPQSALVRLAEQKIAVMEQGDRADQGLSDDEVDGAVIRNA